MPINENMGSQDSKGTMDNRTLEELQDEARRIGVSGFGAMNRSDLIKALQTHKQNVK